MELIDKYVWYQEGPGVRKNQYTSSGVKLLNVANLVEGKIELSTSSRYISEDEANGRYNHFLVDEGDLIIASSGIQVSYFEKKMGIAEKKHLPLCMNTSTIRFKVLDKKIMDIRYFMYFLKSNLFKNQIRKLITGSAQLNFGPSHLKKIKIEVPELKKQQEIVRKLDKVKKIIDIRRNQIIEFNELIKSQFVEMFGDPIINEKKWNVDTIKNVAPRTKYFGKFESKVWILNLDMIESGTGNIIKYMYEDLEKIKSSTCTFNEEYVLYSKLRPYLNKVVVPIRKGYATSEIIPLKPDITRIEKQFLAYLLRSEQFVNYISLKTIGAKMPRVSMEILMKFNLILPPLSLQNQFSEIVKQIDKQKFEIEKSLKEIQELYESLMEKYFG